MNDTLKLLIIKILIIKIINYYVRSQYLAGHFLVQKASLFTCLSPSAFVYISITRYIFYLIYQTFNESNSFFLLFIHPFIYLVSIARVCIYIHAEIHKGLAMQKVKNRTQNTSKLFFIHIQQKQRSDSHTHKWFLSTLTRRYIRDRQTGRLAEIKIGAILI